MSYSALLELRKSVDEAIDRQHTDERQELTNRLANIAKLIGSDMGAAPAKTMPAKRGSPNKGRKVKLKYRNPKQQSETWTGRGRQPRWLVHQLATGKKIESFLIR